MADTLFIVLLGIIVVSPRRLPQLLRQLGHLVVEVRRAKNDFSEQLLGLAAASAELPPSQDPSMPCLAEDTIHHV